jgi:itaconate CoA-transferase
MPGLQNARERSACCDKVLPQPALARDTRVDANPRRVEPRAARRATVLHGVARLTAAQVIERLEAAPIADARLNTMADVWQHEQLLARGRLAAVAIRALRAHTDALLAELGYTAPETAALHARGAV